VKGGRRKITEQGGGGGGLSFIWRTSRGGTELNRREGRAILGHLGKGEEEPVQVRVGGDRRKTMDLEGGGGV